MDIYTTSRSMLQVQLAQEQAQQSTSAAVFQSIIDSSLKTAREEQYNGSKSMLLGMQIKVFNSATEQTKEMKL